MTVSARHLDNTMRNIRSTGKVVGSDRIAVMYRGKIVAVVDGRTANKEEVGLLMATGGRDASTSDEGPAA